ncbi:hypothetical protein [Pseudomonas sp. PDM27]|uniref:hypothetical protein n=1 Tax=Pseudomonas sp. PDM27 TaxID=2854769 RepID=UPI001C47F15C|nr:hypothetical protein [Pseudomonas sp. PDM27]MBV7569669.1 hypothetical protein [Pseudomonas sp. PDM27]
MKMEQNTPLTSTALLRNARSVDASETNSLCGAAAGIISSLIATAEARLADEKLHEAATTDATLFAQSRPLAQPVMGYTGLSSSNKLSRSKESNERPPSMLTDFISSLTFDTFKNRQTGQNSSKHILSRRRFRPVETTHPTMKLKSKTEPYAHSLSIELAPLNFCEPEQLIGINTLAVLPSEVRLVLSSSGSLKHNYFAHLSAQAKKSLKLRNFKSAPFIISDSHLMAFLPPRHRNGNCNTYNRTDCLYPSSGIRRQHSIFNPVRNRSDEKPQTCTTDGQPPNSPKGTSNQLFRNFQPHYSSRLLASIKCGTQYDIITTTDATACCRSYGLCDWHKNLTVVQEAA